LSADERIRIGREARHRVKRSDQATWNPSLRRESPADQLRVADEGRLPDLLAVKRERMARSPFGFFRGAVPVMAADLASLPDTGIRSQLCGDAHVRNLGALAGPDGRLLLDLNDFDETIVGPWEWDVKRMTTSLILAGREAGNHDHVCRDGVRGFASTYRESMAAFSRMSALDVARYRVHRPFEGGPGSALLRQALTATPEHCRDRFTEDDAAGKRRFKEERPLLTRIEPATAHGVLEALGGYRSTLAPERRHLFEFYQPVDVAFKVVGTGSVGLRDYVVMLEGPTPADSLFLQVKQAVPSAYAKYVGETDSPRHQGERVVLGHRQLQTQSDPLLGWTTVAAAECYVRQLSDHKASIELDQLMGKALIDYAETAAQILAKAHARAGDPWIIAGYLGDDDGFDQGLEAFAVAYADQTESDWKAYSGGR
jgi:uncharacterized protein (DUF2252 family)